MSAKMKIVERSYKGPFEPTGIRGRIGLIALASDSNSESDLRRDLPDEVELFTSRVYFRGETNDTNLGAMAHHLPQAARSILPDAPLDVMIYGCTSGALVIGEERLESLIQYGRPGIPVTNPAKAAVKALRAKGAKALSILTPYTSSLNELLILHLESKGFKVNNLVSLGVSDDDRVTSIPPKELYKVALKAMDSDSDALFISCTALRTLEILKPLEMELGKHVVSSNQALLWDALSCIRKS